MKEFRAPDLNAPRFRPKTLNLLNVASHKKFIEKHPNRADLKLSTFKNIVHAFGGIFWNTVIEERAGVELPEGLGTIFVGSCPAKKGPNPDYKASKECGKLVQHKNHDTDGMVAKIFYSNYNCKYKMSNREVWMFDPVRDFSREVATSYPENYLKYVKVLNEKGISEMLKKQSRKGKALKKQEELLKDYDEFNLD